MTGEQERLAGDWMRQAQTGDRDAYASLLVLLTRVTRQFARGRVGGVPWLDDVVQETLVTVHQARRTYDPARPFAPWFYAIASSRLIDVIRRERRIASRETLSDELPDTQVADEGRGDLDVEAIRAAVAALPGRQRDVIVGLKYRGETVREVSQRMQMTEAGVKAMAHRGYQTLRRLLGGRRDEH